MQENAYYRELTEYFHFAQKWLNGRSPNTDDAFSRNTDVTPQASNSTSA